MIAFFIYVAILTSSLIAILTRNKILLLQGKNFLRFNLLFFVITILALVTRGTLDNDLIAFLILLIPLIASVSIRKKWIVFRYSAEPVSGIIEDSLSRTLMPFQKTEKGYIVKSSTGAETFLRINKVLPKCAILSFEGELRMKKVEVWQNLLKKSFDRIFPRLVIRLK